jgi:hypothetical protein
LVGTPRRSASRSRSSVAPARVDALGDELDQDGGLARARGADHCRRHAVGQAENGQLGGVERDRGDRPAGVGAAFESRIGHGSKASWLRRQ